ncbi:MAG: MinD/ParA family protein [Nitrospiraceae bacterium]|nr:MAG: MinD/ParA family protein [Nitrospiraceae bacterium]
MNIAEGKKVRTIAVASGKGGVGKTNITANLAIGFSKLNKKVLVFDADLGLSNIDVILNLATQYNIKHLFRGEKKLKDLVVEGPLGIKVLPASSGIQELTELDEFQRLRLIEEFEAYDSDVDYLLIDTSSGISANVAFFCMAAQEIIIVTSAEPTAMTDAYALIKVLFTKYQEKNFKILVNNVKNEKEARDVYKRLSIAAEKFLSISLDYLGHVPYDPLLQKAVRQQKALIEIYPDSEAAKSILEIVQRISTETNNNIKGTLQFFLGGLLKAKC